MDLVVALDVGGTSMKGAVAGRDGTLLLTERRPTGRERGPEAVIAEILGFAAHLADRAATPPLALGLAVPGIVDDANGTAVYSANIGWRDVPMRALAAERLGLPVAVAHDVRTGGLGEAVLGAGRGAGDFLFVPIGTGVCGAVVIGGEPYPGVTGSSGELGHLVVRPGGELCGCGQRGCVEAYASGSAIARRAGMPAEKVIARAEAGDAAAAAVWEEALDTLADALTISTMLLDPRLILLGGGLAEAGARLTGPLVERLEKRFTFRSPPRVATAALGDRAAMLGAAVLAWRMIG
ncbi:MAG: hypothetical protein JWN00_3444 [Actinomycetia bacterium]|nr:hypothetical protein [Actinomycetes bacterium]